MSKNNIISITLSHKIFVAKAIFTLAFIIMPVGIQGVQNAHAQGISYQPYVPGVVLVDTTPVQVTRPVVYTSPTKTSTKTNTTTNNSTTNTTTNNSTVSSNVTDTPEHVSTLA